jgi:NADH dehydrogenase (ubiquinone) Fe-S protein 6
MELIAKVPIVKIKGTSVTCDGGGGALGHPRVFISLEKPGPQVCGYCGLRFEQDHDYDHHGH